MSNRDSGNAAKLRAEQIRRRGRSYATSQASRSMDERLRQMNERATPLDGRLRRHAEESTTWHRKWDDTSRIGAPPSRRPDRKKH